MTHAGNYRGEEIKLPGWQDRPASNDLVAFVRHPAPVEVKVGGVLAAAVERWNRNKTDNGSGDEEDVMEGKSTSGVEI